jgi:peptide/nickel transport system ATP-binding protein
MQVCSKKDPIEQRLPDGRRVACWLHGPDGAIPAGGRERLERAEIGVADEA